MMNTKQLHESAQAFYVPPNELLVPEFIRPADRDSASVSALNFSLRPLLETIDENEMWGVVHDIARHLRLVEYSGQNYEVATANDEAGKKNGYMLHISTYGSSITNNANNAVEMARQVLRFPDMGHAYVASYGNGGTSPVIRNNGDEAYEGDAVYVSHEGRFTREVGGETVAIETIVTMLRALESEGLDVVRLMGTDSAGGSYATALGVAMERNQLTHAFFSERSGFVNLSRGKIVKAMLINENLQNSKQNAVESKLLDNNHVTQDTKKRAQEILLLHGSSEARQLLQANLVGRVASLSSMRVALDALRRGPSEGRNPLVADADALHARHDGAAFTYVLAEHDPLYTSPEIALRALEHFLRTIKTSQADIYAMFMPGMSHAWNTHFPDMYDSAQARALYRTRGTIRASAT